MTSTTLELVIGFLVLVSILVFYFSLWRLLKTLCKWISGSRLLAVLLMVAFLPVPAHADHGTCFYDPTDMHGYGCSQEDVLMLALMGEIEGAKAKQDWEGYSAAWRRMWVLQIDHPELTVNFSESLDHYQVLNSVHVGDVKFAVLPSHQLVIEDKWRRETKIAGHWTTNRANYGLNFVAGYLGGSAVSPWIERLLWGQTWWLVSVSTSSAGMTYAILTSSVPDVGETEYLVHQLQDDGLVQRANIHVEADGHITVVAEWAPLGYVEPGGDW